MNKGFTTIEMLVVIGVMALMSSVLMVYGRTGERQINLFKEQARIISALSRAKYLSVSTFGKTDVPCGYGVHFEAPRTFLIFKDLPSGNCSLADKKYSGAGEIFESFGLDSVITFDQLTLSDIVFTPPGPSVVITPDQDQAAIIIKIINIESSAAIKINSAGQISR
ncbi:MAG: prepilin-type N-terminal cleavage/methylation domain-containing protein [Patescibacteria group bacterium]